jgi:radical SAM protein with 4Fe4S-binding SPASM domain
MLDRVLRAASQIKEKHAGSAPIVGARVVITNMVYKEALSILGTLKNRGFDYALFKIVRDYEDRGLGIGKLEEEYLKGQIFSGCDIDEGFTNIKSIFDYKNAVLKGEKCIVNEASMIANIDADGKVYPNIVEIGNADFCIGDLHCQPLGEIWNGDRHIQVKDASNRKWRDGKCANCRAIAYNNIIGGLLGSLPGNFDPFV